MAWGYWNRYTYVSKAEKIRNAEKAKAALRKKKGAAIEPVEVSGREIARTWWGKSWNKNLEQYSDYENRLPRGRTYVRSGAVLDLKIAPNTITAMVSGSRAKPYNISINIRALDKKNEQALMDKSRASLDSMQSLLSGEFPSDLKELFLTKGTGFFPAPSEIEFSCSCPDWASMCKHVAAVLYGTAVRLDEKPELFFILRGIQIADFVGEMVKHETKKLLKRANAKSERVLAANEEELSKLFGIVMDEKPADGSAGVVPRVPAKGKQQRKSAVPPKKIVRVLKKKHVKDHMKKAMARSKAK
jgi:uncharacterized Zn finger protein